MSDHTPSLDKVLSEALMEVYDNGSNPNALREARAVIARIGDSAWAEDVRAEEREKYDPAKDERLARYMALVTPLGYASALEVVNSMTALMDVEARANEIAEQARRDEREKAAQIALDNMGWNGKVIAARIRNQEAGE